MEALLLLAVLACPLLMGGMMLWMRRDMRRQHLAEHEQAPAQRDELMDDR
jgi:hypothetical protein